MGLCKRAASISLLPLPSACISYLHTLTRSISPPPECYNTSEPSLLITGTIDVAVASAV